MRVLFGIIRFFLEWPMPARRLLELVFILLIFSLLWPIIKYLIIFAFKVCKLFNRLTTSVIRSLICKLGSWNRNVYSWDEKTGKTGGCIDGFYDKKIKWLQKSKARNFLLKKTILTVIVILYALMIFPIFHLDNIFEEYYIETFYFLDKMFANMEDVLTQTAEQYPPLFREKEKSVAEEEPVEFESGELMAEDAVPVQLMLRADTYYANIRENASITSAAVCVVSKEDIIFYQNQYIYDGERYWLSVKVESQDNRIGWISHKVLEDDIIFLLQLK